MDVIKETSSDEIWLETYPKSHLPVVKYRLIRDDRELHPPTNPLARWESKGKVAG
ncbi:MAG: hypothetical protein ACF787_10770 [Rhodopirellula sp. JB053]